MATFRYDDVEFTDTDRVLLIVDGVDRSTDRWLMDVAAEFEGDDLEGWAEDFDDGVIDFTDTGLPIFDDYVWPDRVEILQPDEVGIDVTTTRKVLVKDIQVGDVVVATNIAQGLICEVAAENVIYDTKHGWSTIWSESGQLTVSDTDNGMYLYHGVR